MGLFGRDTRTTSEFHPHTDTPGPAPSRSVDGPGGTVISHGATVTGQLSGSTDIRIEGTVDGAIDGRAGVLVAEQGSVTASIRGASVVVAGSVVGDILADERIQLDPTASVVGNLVAPRILIQDGAALQGKVDMKSPPKRGQAPPAKDEPAKSKASEGKDQGSVPAPSGSDSEQAGADDGAAGGDTNPADKPGQGNPQRGPKKR